MNSISLFMNALTSRFDFSGADTDASNGSRHKRALQELYRLRTVFKRELLLRDGVMLQASRHAILAQVLIEIDESR